MKSTVPVGILGYGAYVPRMRVRTEEISDAWRAKGSAAPAIVEKSVASLDEDVVTMSIEAARTALDRARLEPERVGALWVGTESKPYAVKPSATVVAEALGITPRLVAADMEFACKAGSEAMQAAVAFVGSGMVEGAMAIGMDTAQARPGDALEYTAGFGGAAFLFGAAADALAIVERSTSFVTDTPDFFRREHAPYPEHGGRFTGEPSYFRHTLAASRHLLKELDRKPSDYAHAVFHQPVPKFAERVAETLGFSEAQIRVGLVAVLDEVRAGERVFFCSYGSGAGSDAFSFEITKAAAAPRSGPKVQDYLARRRDVGGYGHYLRLRRKIRTH